MLAKEINCERTNVYNIFARKDINTGLLTKLGIILEHNFFKELSDDFSKTEKAKKWKLFRNFAAKYENRNMIAIQNR